MDCSLPGSSVHGIFHGRILECVAVSCSRKSSLPRDRTWVSRGAGRGFVVWATTETMASISYQLWNLFPSAFAPSLTGGLLLDVFRDMVVHVFPSQMVTRVCSLSLSSSPAHTLLPYCHILIIPVTLEDCLFSIVKCATPWWDVQDLYLPTLFAFFLLKLFALVKIIHQKFPKKKIFFFLPLSCVPYPRHLSPLYWNFAHLGLPWWSSGYDFTFQCKGHELRS